MPVPRPGDDILNLFGGVEGRLPDDKVHMMARPQQFLDMDEYSRMLYAVGRRIGIVVSMDAIGVPERRARIEAACAQLAITPDNAGAAIEQILRTLVLPD